jgi:hypothetical protein
MTDQSGAGLQGGTHPAQGNPVSHPAAVPPEFHQPARPQPQQHYAQPASPERARGHRGGPDWRQGELAPHGSADAGQDGQERQQQAAAAPDKITIDGAEWSHEQIKPALARQVESDARKAALPQSPEKYDIKLPPDFKPPEGVRFELDPKSPELARFKQLAHARGVDQETFSDMLGVYAATKIGEQQQLAVARNAELAKLGSAANARIDAIDTWLKARVGAKGNLIVAQMRNYPVAAMIDMFEDIMRGYSNRGSAPYSQSHRHAEEPQPQIPTMQGGATYAQVRAAQDAIKQTGRSGR